MQFPLLAPATSALQYSLCNEPLIELSNPGASGSVFYVTSDDEFIIKTVMHKEAEFLQKLLPGYYMVRVRVGAGLPEPCSQPKQGEVCVGKPTSILPPWAPRTQSSASLRCLRDERALSHR